MPPQEATSLTRKRGSEADRRVNGQAAGLAHVSHSEPIAFPRVVLCDGAAGGCRVLPAGCVRAGTPADAPRREIARRKWLTRRIRYPRVARFLRISRILRVNPRARPASGAAGTGVAVPAQDQSWIIASMAR